MKIRAGLAAAAGMVVLAAASGRLRRRRRRGSGADHGVWQQPHRFRSRSWPTACGPPTCTKSANVGWFLLGDGVVAVDSGSDSAAGGRSCRRSRRRPATSPSAPLILTHPIRITAAPAPRRGRRPRDLPREPGGRDSRLPLTQASADPKDPLAGRQLPAPGRVNLRARNPVDGIHNAQIYSSARRTPRGPRRSPQRRQDSLCRRRRLERPAASSGAVAGRGSGRLGSRAASARARPGREARAGPRRDRVHQRRFGVVRLRQGGRRHGEQVRLEGTAGGAGGHAGARSRERSSGACDVGRAQRQREGVLPRDQGEDGPRVRHATAPVVTRSRSDRAGGTRLALSGDGARADISIAIPRSTSSIPLRWPNCRAGSPRPAKRDCSS